MFSDHVPSYSQEIPEILCDVFAIFAIGLVNSVVNLLDGQVKFFEEFKLQKNCEIHLLIKTFLGLVEIMFGLVNVSFSLPEWQAEMTFFAPCLCSVFLIICLISPCVSGN